MLEQIKSLTQEERDDAKRKASQLLKRSYGEMPSKDDFAFANESALPSNITKTITILCIVVLGAAFVWSSMHLFEIGYKTFYSGMENPNAAMSVIAGVATILLAEAAQLVSTLALAAFGKSLSARVILYLVAFAATLIAVTGNATMTLKATDQNFFTILLAFLPPLIVIGVAHILKHQWLHDIANKHACEQAYLQKLKEWNDKQNLEVDKHPEWKMYFANALRDAIKTKNNRSQTTKELVQKLTTGDWKALVWREMQSDAWFEIPEQPHAEVHVPVLQASVEPSITVMREQKPKNAIKKIAKQNSGGGGGKQTGEIDAVVKAAAFDGTNYVANCPRCNREFIKSNRLGLARALSAHIGSAGCKANAENAFIHRG